MKSGLPAFILLIALFYTQRVPAQAISEDSILNQTALEHTLAVYYDQLGDQSPIYNGSLYRGYTDNFREGSPYFLGGKATPGSSVVYDSVLFINLTLTYEDLKQILILEDGGFRLQLVNDRVSNFSINGHQFVRVFPGSPYKGLPDSGYYEIRYSGATGVLKWTKKKLRELISSSEGITRYVDETDSYYIYAGQKWLYVKSRKDLLLILGDHRKEIQRFIRKNNLNYRRDKDNTIVQVAGYYDQIAK
jgi:hypothetical protein